jgi:RNA polymerase sigma-70 factor (ECF subfamily)
VAEVYNEIHRELIEKSKKGDMRAQFRLYELYSKAMMNICYRLLNCIETAEDLLQESFCEAFMKLDTFRYESSFGAWLKKIVINRCINEIKKRKANVLLFDDIKKFDSTDEPENIDYEDIQLNVNKILNAMKLLPEGYRIIFSLYLLEGYDHIEISQILGITESTSKSQYMRAKEKLKTIIKTMQL